MSNSTPSARHRIDDLARRVIEVAEQLAHALRMEHPSSRLDGCEQCEALQRWEALRTMLDSTPSG